MCTGWRGWCESWGLTDPLLPKADFASRRERALRLRAHLFFYVGAAMLIVAALLLPVTILSGEMTWAAMGIVAVNIAVGGIMHAIGRWLRRKPTP